MPPTKLLDPQYIDMLTRWIMAGMPQTAEEAAKLQATPLPGLAVNLTGDPTAGLVVFTANVCNATVAMERRGLKTPVPPTAPSRF